MLVGSPLQACACPAPGAGAPSILLVLEEARADQIQHGGPVFARGGASALSFGLVFALFRRAAVRAGLQWFYFGLSCALRCEISPRSAHGVGGWPESIWFAQIL